MAKQLNVKLNFQADTSQAEQALAKLTMSLNQISSITPTVGTKLTDDLATAKQSALDLQRHLNNAFNAKTGNLDLSKLDASLKSSGQSLGQLSTNLLKAGSSGESAFLNIQRAVGNASVQINQANGVLTQFWTTLKNTARWQLSSSLLHGFIGGLQSAWGYAKDLDESLNNIRIVTGYSVDKMSDFAEQANKAAKALSTTTTAYTDAALIYYQQGLSDDEVLKRTDITVKMANVARQSAEVVSDQLTAIWNNFYDGSKSLEYYADVLTALGAATASSTDEIAGGLEKFAAIGETIGLSYEYAASALATITSNTRQSEEVVGTALKTIFARIQGLNLGETLEDGTTLNKYSEALQKVGISIFEQNGELKDMDSILDEMASKWQTMSRDQQTALAQTVAGVRQYTQLVALMDNWDNGDNDSMTANLDTSYNATGALNEQAEIYADSWEAAVNRVKASAEGIYRDLLPTEEMTDMMKGVEVLLEGIDGLIRGFGGLEGILLLVSTIALNTFRNQIGGAIDDLISKVGGGLSTAFHNISNAFKTDGILGGFKAIVGYSGNIVNQTQQLNTSLQMAADNSQSIGNKMALTEKAMAGSTSQALKFSMEMTQSANNAQGLTDAFRQYNSNLVTINNVQSIIEQSAKHLTKEQKEQLVIMQEQAQAANEQVLSAKKLADEAQRRQSALLRSGGDQGSDLDRYISIENGKNAGKTAYTTDLMNTGNAKQGTGNIGMVSSGLATYTAAINAAAQAAEQAATAAGKGTEEAKKAGEAVKGTWDSAKVSLDSYKNHLALVFDESINLTEVNKEVNTAYGDLITTSADVADAIGMWGEEAANIPVGKIKEFTGEENRATAAAKQLDSALDAALEDLGGKGKLGAELAREIQAGIKPTMTLQEKTAHISQGLEQATEKMRTLGVATGSSEKYMENIKNGALNVRDTLHGAASATTNLNNKIAQVATTLKTALNSTMSFGKILSGMASGFSSIAMGINAISNAIETFKDEDASFTSKLTAGAMAATMGMQGLMAALGGLSSFINSVQISIGLSNGIQAVNNVLTQKKIDLTTDEGAAMAATLIVQKLNIAQDQKEAATEAALTMIKEKGVKATYKQVAADYANVASQAARFWWISLIIIGIVALTAATIALVKAIQESTNEELKAAKAYKVTTENLENMKSAYDEAKTSVQNFKSEISDYQDALNNVQSLALGAEGLADAVEEANTKARELIKTYGLLREDYYYGARGEIIFNEGVLEKEEARLNNIEKRAEIAYYSAAYANEIAKGDYQTAQQVNADDLDHEVTYYRNYEHYKSGRRMWRNDFNTDPTRYATREEAQAAQANIPLQHKTSSWRTSEHTQKISADEYQALGKVINYVTEELGEIPENADELKAAFYDSSGNVKTGIQAILDEFGVGSQVLPLLDQYVNDNTFPALMSFTDSVALTTEACSEYARQILSLTTDDEYSAGITRAAGGDQTKENLMYQIKDKLVITPEMLQAQEERQNDLYEDVIAPGATSYNTKTFVQGLNSDDTSFDYDKWMRKNYSEIFAGTTMSYDPNMSDADKGKAWLESQGYTVTSSEKDGDKVKYSLIDPNGDVVGGGFEMGIDDINRNWSTAVGNYAIDQDISQMATNLLDPTVFEEQMANIVKYGEQYGADFSNAILAGIANNGNFDFSSVFSELSETEIAEIKGMSGQELAKKFLGITDEQDLKDLGFESWGDFETGFKEGLEGWDPSIYRDSINKKYETIAEDNDIDVGTFKAYRSSAESRKGFEDDSGENYADEWLDDLENTNVEEYTEALNELAIMQTRLARGYKTLGTNWEDWNKVMSDSEASIDDINEIMPDLNEALADILNWDVADVELLPHDFAQKHWDVIQDVYNGVDGAQERLAGLAANEYVLSLKVDTAGFDTATQDAYKKMTTWLQNMPDLEVGMTLDDTGMTSAFNALLASGAVTVDQMNTILSKIGFTPEIKYKEVEITGDHVQQIQSAGGFTRLNADGSTTWVPISSDTSTDTYVGTKMAIPYIDGGETPYTGGGGVDAKPPKEAGKKSGGGSEPKKAEPTRKADVVERYKEVNDSLDDIKEAMDDANRAADKLWGKNRLAMMKKVAGQMEDELDKLKEKKKLAEETYLKEDIDDLNEATDDAGVARFEFDAKGNIINYDEIMGGLYDELHAAEEEAGDEWSESEQKKIEAIKKRIEKVKEAQENYDATKEEIEDWQNEIEEALLAIQQQYFDIWAEGIEIDLAIDEADLAVIEYYLSKVQDDIYGIVETLTLTKQQADIAAENLDQYQKDKAELDRLHTEINPETGETYINDAQYIEGLQDLQSKIYENLDAINAATDAYQNAYSDALAAASEELANYTDQMEHHNSVLEHYNNLLNLTGQSKDYEKMNNVLEASVHTAENMAAVSKSNYDMLSQKAKEKEAAWLAVGKDPGEELTEQEQAIKNEWLAAQQAANEAQDQMLSDAEAWAEALNALLENKLANLADILDDKLAGNFGSLEDMNIAMERASSLQEEYLTTTNKIYETNKLMNTAQQEIDKTTNTVAKRKLKAYIEETEQLQNKNKLSQYELDIQQAKYDLLLAEIALEEAQDAKSTVRLQRDAEGNFGYVYTADQDAVADAEQKLADAQNALYNIGLEGANDYTEKYAATIQEMNDEITALTQAWQEGEIASEQEYQDQMAALKKYYYEKLEGYSELYGIAIMTDGQVVQDAWSTQFAGMTANTAEWMTYVDEYVTGVRTAFSEWATEMEEVTAYTIGENLTDLAGKTGEIKTKSDELVTTITDPTNGVIKALGDELTAVDAVSQAYWEWYQNILSVIEAAEGLGETIADIIEEESEEDEEDPPGGTVPPEGTTPPPEGTDPPANTGLEIGKSVTVKKSATHFTRDGGNGTKMKDFVPGGTYTVMEVDGDEVRIGRNGVTTGWVKKTDLEGFDTGGYTGSWGPYGKLAMLHEKELVLNAHDTDNFLNTMEVMERILQMLDLQTMSSQIGGILSSPGLGDTGSQIIEQHIEIEANFPDATDRFEIEEAFKSMANLASQYANRK